jgi:hypothetical protein
MAGMAHVLDKKFLDKLPTSENMERNPTNIDHKELLVYWQQNAKAVAAIVATQESEDVILGLHNPNELVLTFPGEIVCNYWKELKTKFQPDNGLSKMSTKENLYKLKFSKRRRSKEFVFENCQYCHAVQALASQFEESGTYFETWKTSLC